ncbi:putative hypothetical protein [Streptomyces sp. NBRC 110611]|nr:putative hypothetical protein [Streptomyces sp. NBRC 110611]
MLMNHDGERGACAGGLSHYGEALRLQECPGPGAHGRMVVDQDHTYGS